MKRTFRFFFAAVVAVMLFALLAVAACGPEGEDPADNTAELILDAGEGTVESDKYDVEVDADLYEFLKDKAPTPPEGLTFAGWYLGDDAIQEEDTMPAGGGTLIAKYYAQYTFEVYLEGENGFEKSEENSTTGTAIYGEPFTVKAPSIPHYAQDGDQAETKLKSDALGKNEVFKAYYALSSYAVVYDGNAPRDAGLQGTIDPQRVKYGKEVTVAGGENFTVAQNYRFAGWSDAKDGAVKYQKGDKIKPEGNVVLYAIWDVAYTDRFGGDDYIFFPQTDDEVAILLRVDEEIVGTRDGETFLIEDEAGNEIVKGKAAAGTFVYFRTALADVTYKHADAYTGELLADSADLSFDGFGGAVYTDAEGEHAGSIVYDPRYMTYQFRYDANQSEGFEFMLTDADGTPAFIVSGMEEGSYLNFSLSYVNGNAAAYTGDLLVLDGYGTAVVYDGESLELQILSVMYIGYYQPRGESGEIDLMLMDSQGNISELTVGIMSYSGTPVWYKDTGYAGKYTGADGATLELDAFGATAESAVYTKGSDRISGLYTVDPLLGIVRLVPQEGKVIAFRVDIASHALTVLGDGDYREYLRYYGESGANEVGTPVLTLGEGNTATYGTGMNKIEGTVSEVDGIEGRFLFDSKAVKFQYELGEDYLWVDGRYAYIYFFKMYPVTGNEGSTFTLTEAGEGKGTIVATWNMSSTGGYGDAVYTDGAENTYLGVYTVIPKEKFNLKYDIAEFMDIDTGISRYFGIFMDAEGKTYTTFSVLGDETGIYYQYAGGEVLEDVSLFLIQDSDTRTAFYKNGAEDAGMLGTYTLNEDGVGTVTCGTTELTVLVENDGTFTVHTKLWEGSKTFTSDGHTLALDGFYTATYDGNPIEYAFVRNSETRIFLLGYIGGNLFEGYFDIDLANGTYTACGYEVGTYYDEASDDLIVLNGYGEVKLYNITQQNADETLKELKSGKYAVISDGYDEENIYVRITFEGEEAFDALLYAVSDGEDITLFYRVKDEAADTYKSARREYFTFNGFGDAYYTDIYGITYQGEYEKRTQHVYAFAADNLDGIVYIKLGAEKSFEVHTTGFLTDGDVLVKYLGGSTKDIVITEGIKTIAELAFSEHVMGSDYEGAAITSVDLKDVVTVGNNAFNGCEELKSVTGALVKTVGDNAFYACIELSAVSMNALETIGENAFHLCESLTEIGFESVKTVYSSAFSDCHELTTVELPAIENIYEGVFFDCFMLGRVTLGEHLVQLGTSEEHVAGVFERSAGYDQVPLMLVLGGDTVPADVCEDLFAGVTNYTIKVPTMSEVKAFYADEAWAKYNPYVGTATEYDGTYYYYEYGIYLIDFNVIAKQVIPYQTRQFGAYEIDAEGNLTLYTFDPETKTYTTTEGGTFSKDGKFTNKLYNDYEFIKAGAELTMTKWDSESEKLVFTPADADVYAIPGVLYTAPAKYTKEGTDYDVTVRISCTDENSSILFEMDWNGYRYHIDLYSGMTFDMGSSAFIPVPTFYEAEDGSVLTVARNNADGTDLTASFRILSIRDANGVALTGVLVPVEKQKDGTVTAEPVLFNGYSYLFTFTLTEAAAGEEAGSFGYTYTLEKRTVFEFSADNLRLAVNQNNQTGEITSMLLYFVQGDEEVELSERTKFFEVSSEGRVFTYLIYDHRYAACYTFAFSDLADLTCEMTKVNGIVGNSIDGVLYGISSVAFLNADGSFMALYTCVLDDNTYTKISAQDVSEQDGVYTIVKDGNRYALTVNAAEGTSTFVILERTLHSAEEDEIQGTLHVVVDENNEIQTLELTVGEAKYTEYSILYIDDEWIYRFTSSGKTYHVTFGSVDCEILEFANLTLTDTANNITMVYYLDNLGDPQVLSLTINGKAESAAICSGTGLDGTIVAARGETNRYFIVDFEQKTFTSIQVQSFPVEEEGIRLDVYVVDGKAYVIGVEVLQEGAYRWIDISYQSEVTWTDEYNYEIDLVPAELGLEYANYYFNITVDEDGTVTLEYVSNLCW